MNRFTLNGGALNGSAATPIRGKASLAASGVVTAPPAREARAAAALTGTATSTGVTNRQRANHNRLTLRSTLYAPPTRTRRVARHLAGVATLRTSSEIAGAARLPATATLSPLYTRGRPTSAALAGTATSAFSTRRTRNAPLTLAGTATLALAPRAVFRVSRRLEAKGRLGFPSPFTPPVRVVVEAPARTRVAVEDLHWPVVVEAEGLYIETEVEELHASVEGDGLHTEIDIPVYTIDVEISYGYEVEVA